MSSRYNVICLSHDPAIVEYDDSQDSYRIELVMTGKELKERHRNCDVVIGRYSYPLIEVTCMSRIDGRPAKCHHTQPETIDAGWLRLLYRARQAGMDGVDEMTRHAANCWPVERLERLAPLFFEEDES